MTDLIFIGGIHGVGKGTICRQICADMDYIHLTASQLLRWDELSDPQNKKVDNIQNTQDRLITGLRNIVKENHAYLLDGHFCLFNSKGEVEKVPEDTFQKINPRLISVVIKSAKKIKRQLENRDNATYDLTILEEMQNTEIEHSKHISSVLNVPLVEIRDNDYRPLIQVIG